MVPSSHGSDQPPAGDYSAKAEPRGERLLQFFSYQHLWPDLQPTSRQFHDMAVWITENLPPNPERTLALRCLWDAKNYAVIAAIAK